MSVPKGFTKVARLADLRERRGRMVRVGDREVALWLVADVIYAIDNLCPHQHTRAMHTATLDGIHVTCPMHGWTFSLESGLEKSGNGRIGTYRVHLEGDDVCIEERGTPW